MVMMFIEREITPLLISDAAAYPAITLTGPRQSGKTTLCQKIFPDHKYVNLESPDIRRFAQEDPRGFLADLPDGAILDEFQRVPDIPSYLQSIIDSDRTAGKWILTGSQNLTISQTVSQSLAGRTSVRQLFPFTLSELTQIGDCEQSLEETLFRGLFPPIYDTGCNTTDWYRSYIATYLERDVRMVKNIDSLTRFQQYVELSATRSAQLLNYASLAGDCGISQPTAKSWGSVLEASHLVYRLRPFFGNLRKRIVKMPKLHFVDTGLLCFLLGIQSADQLRFHPLFGSIFETWAVSEIFKRRWHAGENRGLSFYRDSNGAEVDLIIQQANSIVLVDAKASKTATTNLLSGIKRVEKHFQCFDSVSNVVIYAGEQLQNRTFGTLLPWNKINDLETSSFSDPT